LKTILYVPNFYFQVGQEGYIDSLLWTLQRDSDSIADKIGDARWLCQMQHRVDTRWYGFGFKRSWSDESSNFPQNQVPAKVSGAGFE
jgi:hypothetical protein